MQQALIAFASSRLALIVTGYLCLTLFPGASGRVVAGPGVSRQQLDRWLGAMGFVLVRIDRRSASALSARRTSRTPTSFRSIRGCRGWWRCRCARCLNLEQRVLHWRACRVVRVVSARPHRGLSAGDDAGGADVATRTMWLIAVFPFSFFFTAVYADALYFCLCAWCADLCVRAALARRVRAGCDGGHDAHPGIRALSRAGSRISSPE